MKKIININFCGRIVNIEDDAWQIQRAYIETLHGYFINEEGLFEIINDFENRITELMLEIINRQKAPINETNMENIIRVMGTAEEFKDLDTDDWDIAITSPEHCNAIDSSGTIKPGYNLNKNACSYSGESKLCYN